MHTQYTMDYNYNSIIIIMMIIASIGTLYIQRRAAEGYRNWYYTVSRTAAVTVPEKLRERERDGLPTTTIHININLIDCI